MTRVFGYEPRGRTLAIHESEAETVRAIFRLYHEHGNVRQVKKEADRLGLVSKLRHGAGGKMRGGMPLSRGHIYDILSNPLYVGRIAHKGETYEGQHPAIIETEAWDAVQAKLAVNAPERSSSMRVTEPSLLKGKLFDDTGMPLTPSHTVKSGRRYRYYVSRKPEAQSLEKAERVLTNGWRLPAREIERLVADGVCSLLTDRAKLLRIARDAAFDAERVRDLLVAVDGFTGAPLDLVTRIEIRQNEVVVYIDLSMLLGGECAALHYAIPARVKRRGVEMCLVLEEAGASRRSPNPNAALSKAVFRAHQWFEALVSGRARSFDDIVQAEGVTEQYVGRVMPLAFLAPDIVKAIVEGDQPVELTAERLIKRVNLPHEWAQQRKMLGIS